MMQPAGREYRNWVMDSRRWQSFRPRDGDVVVATYPKCGTTWMQRIVNLLIFQTPDPQPISQISPWYDLRFGPPVEAVNALLDGQTHRRSVKTHLPFDGLPRHDQLRYIHVARDGRDACLSFHNHGTGFSAGMLEKLDRSGLEDPDIAKPYERLPPDPADYFHLWLTGSRLKGFADGHQHFPFFDFQRSYWEARKSANLLMVHYADLKRDLAGEMRRVAAFLGIEVDEAVWPTLVEAASFKAMKEQGSALVPAFNTYFEGGTDRFFHKAENGRWKHLFRRSDLDLFERKMATLPEACRAWLAAGRLETGDPRLS